MISLYEARPGQGKTTYAMKMIDDLLHFSLRKYKVASNVPTVVQHERFISLPPSGWDPVLEVIYQHLEKDFDDVKKEGTLVIILDELSLMLNARNWDSLPNEVQFILRQHRHFGVDIVGFSQSVQDIDVAYRRLVQNLHSIHKIAVLPLLGVGSYGLFMIRDYDPDDVEVKRREREPVGFPRFKLIDPPIYKMFNSWERYRFPRGHVTETVEYTVCSAGHKHVLRKSTSSPVLIS